jgi:superfamily II RNA helicase
LSSFQKYSIESTVEGHHSLVCVPTGSGKTLAGEFAIEHFVGQGKKVIYTSPIKALSNQKFYDFQQKFPHISFGILTGDIKFNPEADVLIMTAEILLNTLYKKRSESKSIDLTSFDMDFDSELACVVMDEVHYINDMDRGNVWEETILLLPPHIQMVMLSATLDSPEKFALWCENRGTKTNNKTENLKQVYLTPPHERIVPLTHYSFITCNSGLFKVVKDKATQQEIMKTTNTLHVLQTAKGQFQEENFQKIKKTLHLFEKKEQYIKRANVLNQVSKYMVEKEMLPAICFVFSRKALEVCAKEITTNLLEFDSKVPYTVQRECEQIIRKLPNYQEYLQLPEYVHMVSLLEKGIAIHHAGIMPVLREMVELLFAKGYIKLLFATETFAVGINMPTKTVVFTDVKKFDGTQMRLLHSHEYTQMAGRAGRRGIDTVGHVIHLNNLFKNIDSIDYRNMMKGDPQKLTSKFKISYNLLLNLIDIGDQNFIDFAKKSMMQENNDQVLKTLYYQKTNLEKELETIQNTFQYLKTPIERIEKYIDLLEERKNNINSKRKEIDKKLFWLKDEHIFVENERPTIVNYREKKIIIENIQKEIILYQESTQQNVVNVLQLLESMEFIKKTEENALYELGVKGTIASRIREVHCILFAKLLVENKFEELTLEELVAFFACFANVTVPENIREVLPRSTYPKVQSLLFESISFKREIENKENEHNINTGSNCEMQFDIMQYAYEWCAVSDIIEGKLVIQKMEQEKEIFLGEFVKAMLKINNISSELEKIAEYTGNMDLLQKLKEIPDKTLKYVATNQSLYI